MAKEKKTKVEKTAAALSNVSGQMIGELTKRTMRDRTPKPEVP